MSIESAREAARHAQQIQATDVLDAAAIVARESDSDVLVVLPREPRIVAQARATARQVGVAVTAEMTAIDISLRFAPPGRRRDGSFRAGRTSGWRWRSEAPPGTYER